MNRHPTPLYALVLFLLASAGLFPASEIIAGQDKAPTAEQMKLIEEHQRANQEKIARRERPLLERRVEKYLGNLLESGESTWVRSLRELRPPVDMGLPLFTGLLDHSAVLVRAEAALSLGQLYGPEALPALDKLVECYLGDTDVAAAAAAEAIGKMGEVAAAAIPSLVERLQSGDGTHRSNKATIMALGNLGPQARTAIPVLVAALHDDHTETAYVAYRSIGKLQGGAPLARQVIEESDATLFLGADGYRAFEALKDGAVSPSIARRLLRDLLRVESIPTPQRIMALEILAGLNPASPEIIRLLLGAVGSDDEMVSHTAANVVRLLQPSEEPSVDVLISGLSSALDRVGMISAEGLMRFGGRALPAVPHVMSFLQAATGEIDTFRVGAYVDLLKVIGPSASPAVPTLLAMLSEDAGVYEGMPSLQGQELRVTIFAALAEIGTPLEARPFIIDVLVNSVHPKAFAAASRAAASLPGGPERQSLVPYLLRALEPNYKDWLITLERFALVGFFQHEHTTTGRLEAIRAIVSIGKPAAGAALPLLNKWAEDESVLPGLGRAYRDAAVAAIEVLSRQKGPS